MTGSSRSCSRFIPRHRGGRVLRADDQSPPSWPLRRGPAAEGGPGALPAVHLVAAHRPAPEGHRHDRRRATAIAEESGVPNQDGSALRRTRGDRGLPGHAAAPSRLRRSHSRPPRGRRNARERLDAALGGHHLRRPLDRLLLLVSLRWRELDAGLHVMDFDQFLNWLEATPIAVAIREHEVLFPWIESLHVLAIALVVGTIVLAGCNMAAFHRIGTIQV